MSEPVTCGILLAIDKPLGCTSHDVVGRVRRALHTRRVGHAGTLDPDASGVLVVGVGPATRLMGLLTLDDKSYSARIQLGSATTTDDAAGEVIATGEVPAWCFDEREAAARVATLVGEIDQVPPQFSAISVGGRRAYDRARAGEDVALEPRHVRIYEACLAGVSRVADDDGREVPAWDVDIRVSKGFYVRSLARDLGRDIGCHAHVSALERTASGDIALGSCVTLDELADAGWDAALAHALDPVSALGCASVVVDQNTAADVLNGKTARLTRALEAAGISDGRVAVTCDGMVVGVWDVTSGRPSCVANFPQGIRGVR